MFEAYIEPYRAIELLLFLLFQHPWIFVLDSMLISFGSLSI